MTRASSLSVFPKPEPKPRIQSRIIAFPRKLERRGFPLDRGY